MEGTPFGRYSLIELLGRGGMGEVWRAHDTAANNRAVAIKLLPPHLAGDSTFVARFRREADAAAQLNNPHIIPIHNYGEIDGRLYVDMRLIEGRDLQEVLADGPLEPARAVRIIEQVAKALHAAHKIGLVHRDVKPSNVLLDEDDFAYLIDFGIARAADETRMTGTGSVIGSWHYMSPERLRAGQVDARSDIYALACVLYECLTGCTPYPGDNFERQITAHLTEPPPRPSSTDPNVPATFDPVIATGMAKDPGQRYATTVELAGAAHDAITRPLAPASAPTLFDGQPAPASGPTLLDRQMPPSPAPHAVWQQRGDPDLAATQQRPPGWAPVPPPWPTDPPPPQFGTPKPPHGRRKLVAIAAGSVIVVAVAATAGYLLLGRNSQPSTGSQPSTRSQPSTAPPPPTPVTPVAEAALDGLLLGPDQINIAMGATGMTVDKTSSELQDGSRHVADKACLPLDSPGQASVYAGSGWTALRGQNLREPDRAHLVGQIVVLFPSAHDANALFTASAQQWPACHEFTYTSAGKPDVHDTVGPVSNMNGILSATLTHSGSTWTCQRALTVANNVAIDVTACSHTQSDAAVDIAQQIAAKVHT